MPVIHLANSQVPQAVSARHTPSSTSQQQQRDSGEQASQGHTETALEGQDGREIGETAHTSWGAKQLNLQRQTSALSPQPTMSTGTLLSKAPWATKEMKTNRRVTPLGSLRAQARNYTGRATAGRQSTWDLFVLVLQNSGLQRTMSKAGYEVELSTLLVADPSSSFFRVTLWRRAAQCAARLVRPGDLVRLNRVGISTFRGTAQAHSTPSTSFRVVWRNDTFTTPHDEQRTTMLTLSQNPRGRGGRRLQPAGPLISQEDELAVERESACDLAAWAKREFPSVASRDLCGKTGDDGMARAGGAAESLATVRKGVETMVRACVVDVSDAERMWVWESSGGKRRKDLVSRATALLTDGRGRDMTLQLWGDLASERIITTLREATLAGTEQAVRRREQRRSAQISTSTGQADMDKPVVFEFTRLRPEFSVSCEALVLNTTQSGEIKALAPQSPEACAVADQVSRATRAIVLGDLEDGDEAMHVSQVAREEGNRLVADAPASATRFESVGQLLSDEGFCGLARLNRVVVRRIDSSQLATHSSSVNSLETHRMSNTRSCSPVTVYVGDPVDDKGFAGGVAAVVKVAVDGGPLLDLLGGMPEELLTLTRDESKAGGSVVDAAVRTAAWAVARSLLDGLEAGGEQGEVVSVDLACVARADENGQVVRGGTLYRLVACHLGAL